MKTTMFCLLVALLLVVPVTFATTYKNPEITFRTWMVEDTRSIPLLPVLEPQYSVPVRSVLVGCTQFPCVINKDARIMSEETQLILSLYNSSEDCLFGVAHDFTIFYDEVITYQDYNLWLHSLNGAKRACKQAFYEYRFLGFSPFYNLDGYKTGVNE